MLDKIKLCSVCKKIKPINEFSFKSKAKNKTHCYCKPCFRLYAKKHYERNREKYGIVRRRTSIRARKRNSIFILEFKLSNPCLVCGEKDPEVLQFDHINREEKFKGVSELKKGYSINTLLDEIFKCQILCANCHQKKTNKEFNRKKLVNREELC
tara:strand:- start:290 stop:751 length:462 start_codon:yes stop_codon:yes gene_type:complete